MVQRGGNGDKFWKWEKKDILFAFGLGMIVFGAAIHDFGWATGGFILLGLPFTTRGDKGG